MPRGLCHPQRKIADIITFTAVHIKLLRLKRLEGNILVVACTIVGAPAPDLGTREAWDSTLRREERGREEQRRRERREEEKRVEREERGRERGRAREGSRMRKCKRLQTKARG